MTRLLVLYQNYNHLARGPMALVLGDYKSDIALVGCYNLYIYILYYIYIYIYIYNYIYIYMCYIYHVSEVYMRYINLPQGKI